MVNNSGGYMSIMLPSLSLGPAPSSPDGFSRARGYVPSIFLTSSNFCAGGRKAGTPYAPSHAFHLHAELSGTTAPAMGQRLLAGLVAGLVHVPRGEFAEPLARVLRAENNVQLQLQAPRPRRQERRGPATGISSRGWGPGSQAEGSASWGLARASCTLRELGSSRRLGGLSLAILILT